MTGTRAIKSLLILGHPRGITSRVYRICLRALGAAPPGGTEGETLNWQRNPGIEPQPFFSRADETYRLYAKYLAQRRRGYVVKDVVQPFVCVRFAEEHPDAFQVLYLHRCPADVRTCQLMKAWAEFPHPEEQVEPFRRVADAEVDYGDLIYDYRRIFDVLEGLGYRVARWNYITPGFKRRRDETLERLARYRQVLAGREPG